MDARLGKLQNAAKETGGNRNVVPKENAMNLTECKEIKRKRAMRS